jgi:hypothetical protein
LARSQKSEVGGGAEGGRVLIPCTTFFRIERRESTLGQESSAESRSESRTRSGCTTFFRIERSDNSWPKVGWGDGDGDEDEDELRVVKANWLHDEI